MDSNFIQLEIAKLAEAIGVPKELLDEKVPQFSLSSHAMKIAAEQQAQITAARNHISSLLWLEFMKKAGRMFTTRREHADMLRKHRKWPLGQRVATLTPQGYLVGKINKHDRHYGGCCAVDFAPNTVDMGDANGARFCHVIPFRNLKKV